MAKAARSMTLEGSTTSGAAIVAGSVEPLMLTCCDRCKIARFCTTEDCFEHEYKIGHKRSCCRPPMLSTDPDDDELQFCVRAFRDSPYAVPPVLTGIMAALQAKQQRKCDKNNATPQPCAQEDYKVKCETTTPQDDDGDDNEWDDMDDDDANNDDGSWETLNSDEDNMEEDGTMTLSPTELIYKYFKQRTYDHNPRSAM